MRVWILLRHKGFGTEYRVDEVFISEKAAKRRKEFVEKRFEVKCVICERDVTKNEIPTEMTKDELVLEVLRLKEENERLRDTNTELSWKLNPDRMGGQYTEEEINNTGWL